MHEVPNLQLCSMRKCDLDIWQHTPRPRTSAIPGLSGNDHEQQSYFATTAATRSLTAFPSKPQPSPVPWSPDFMSQQEVSSFLRPELCDRFITEQQLLCLPPKFGTTLRTRYWSSKLLPVLDATVPAGSRAGTNSLLIWPEF